VALRRGRGEVRLRATCRVLLKIASASPTTIVPTPSGPSVVSAASVRWLETSIPAGVNEEYMVRRFDQPLAVSRW
jgi:hypothetical protein